MTNKTIEKDFENYKIFLSKELDFDLKENAELTPHLSANPTGDWTGLACAVRLISDRFPDDDYKILEVGTAHGHFVRTMYNLLEVLKPGKAFAYGLDSKLHKYCPCQFQGDRMKFVEGSSVDKNTIDSFQDDFHFIFIDGCHCEGHAYTDAMNYSKKVRVGGYIAFHDTSPRFQGGTEQPRTPECSEDTHIGVVKGIEKWDPTKNGFELTLEEYHTDQKYYGGVRVYKKL